MRDTTSTVLIVNGAEPRAYSKGTFNSAMAEAMAAELAPHFKLLTTRVSDGYDTAQEIEKYKSADMVIYQYPIYWFMVPGQLKTYMDDVFAYDEFFTYTDGPYGSGGLMQGKQVMFSTTWNAPEQAFNDTGAFFDGMDPSDAILAMRKAHQYCGFEELPHFSVHNVIRDPQVDANIARLRRHLRDVFKLSKEQAAA